VREALVPRTVGGSVAMPPLVAAGVAARRPVETSRGSSVIWEVLVGFGGVGAGALGHISTLLFAPCSLEQTTLFG